MAEDTNKIGENSEAENAELNEQENKDWQWDAAAPLAQDDFLELDLTASESEEASEEIAPEEETVIESPVEEEQADETESDDEPEVEEDHEAGCCIICGEKIRRSESELYCNECRSKYMKVEYGAGHIVLAIAMVFVAVIAIVSFVSTSKIASTVIEGNKYFDQQIYTSAQKSYSNAAVVSKSLNDNLNAFLQGISTNFNEVTFYDSGESFIGNLVKISAKRMTVSYEQREAFFNLVDTYLTEKELNSKEFADVKECYDFCKKLDKTANEVSEVWFPLIEELSAEGEEGEKPKGDVPTAKEIFAVLDKYQKENPDAEPSIMEYFKFSTLIYADPNQKSTKKEALGHLKAAHDKAGKFSYIYAEQYLTYALECDTYDDILPICAELRKIDPSNSNAYFYESKALIAKKDFTAATKLCDQLNKYCPDDFNGYIIQAEILRLQSKFDAALDVCKKAKEISDHSEIFRQEAIIYMLNGEKDKALKSATEAYSSAYAAAYSGENVSLEALNTAALICKLCGDDKTYDDVKSLLSGEKIEFMPAVTEIINGEKTFEEVFMSGKGDL